MLSVLIGPFVYDDVLGCGSCVFMGWYCVVHICVIECMIGHGLINAMLWSMRVLDYVCVVMHVCICWVGSVLLIDL